MEFRLLGPLEVRAGNGPLPLGGRKQRALLALLLLNANRVVARERLIDELWGDEPPETAVATVQVYVSRLRKLLPVGMLVTRRPGYVLEIGPDLVDVHRFARLVGEARALEPVQARPLLRAALDLWRGPALAEFVDEPTLRAEGARLEEVRLAALEQRLEADLALGLNAELVGELEAVARAHPLRESLRGLYMLALYRAGRQAEALAVYQDGRATLVGELGLDPSLSLQRLEQAILRHDPTLDQAVATDVIEPRDAPVPEVQLGPARKVVTVAFCDAIVSTMTGRRLDPEARQLVMSRYFEVAAAVLQRHDGLVDQFVNDAIVSVFGLPLLHEDDAMRALRAASDLRTAVGELNRSLERDFRSTIDVRIGIDTGEVLTRVDERPVEGDVLKTAARLQQAATAGEILIAAETLALVRDAVDVDQVRPGAYRVMRFEPWASRPLRRLDVPIVGRDRELERLRAAFASAVERRECVICTVLAAAGGGKSRLAREFVAGIDAHVVQGRCLSYGEGVTYSAVIDVVMELEGSRRELLAETPAAAATIALLLGEAQSATAPEEIAWSVRKLFEAGARERPLVVLFDDVQWGEPAFLDLVEQVAYLSTGAPIVLLCLARPELVERRPGWSHGGGEVIELEPLAPAEVDELIDRLLHGEPLAQSLSARIRAAAQGNPLFVEEMLAMVHEADSDHVVVPPTIKALLAARLDQLEPAERELLACGAIEGELFHRRAVEALATSSHPVERTIVALVRKELVRPDRSPILRDDAYRFRHLLIRDAAYDAVPKTTRADLHERFAGWLADRAEQLAERNELLGYHLEQAHRYRAELGTPDEALGERAAAHLAAAGRRAAALSDFEAVAGLLRRALSLGISDRRQHVRAQFELGHALHQTRRTAEAESVLTETHELAARLGEDDVAALALVQRAWNRTGETTMDYDEAQVVSEQAIDVLTRVGDDRGLALARRLRGIALGSRQGSTAAVGAELEQALSHAQASGDKEMLRLTIGSLTNAYLVGGPTPAGAAIERCQQVLESVGGDRVLEATVKRPLALFYAMVARPADANETLDEAAAVLDELNLRTAQVYRFVAADARELAGDLEGAERELLAMFDYFRDLRGGRIDTRASHATVRLARLYCDQQRWDEAAEALAYDPSARNGPSGIGTLRLATRARLAGHERLAEAIPLAERAVAFAERRESDLTNRAEVQLALAEVQLAGGLNAEADASFAAAISLFELKGNAAAARALSPFVGRRDRA